MVNDPVFNSEETPDTWRAIERLADEVADLAGADVPATEFYGQLSARLVSALAAVGAVIWTARDDKFVLEQQTHLGDGPLLRQLQEQGHLRFLDRVRRTAQPDFALPGSESTKDNSPGNPTAMMLLACPVLLDEETACIVEVLQRPTTDPDVQQGQLNLLAAMCESASEFHRNERLRNLLGEREYWEQSDQFSRTVHSAASERRTEYAIVNDGRRLLACDRLSLAVGNGSRLRLKAVSGVERVERRARSVRLLERLCRQTLATNERLCYDGHAENLAPQVERTLQQYVDDSHVRQLLIEPLFEPAASLELSQSKAKPLLGALVVERFDAVEDERLLPRLATVRGQSEIALTNVLRRRGLFARAVDWLVNSNGWMKVAVALLLITTVALAASLIPADFTIEARGRLQAKARQDVFAPVDGEVASVLVQYDDAVQTGQTLAEMTSAELDLERERLVGERRTTQQKLLAAQSERVRSNTPSAEDRRRMATWSAVEKELETKLAAIDLQMEILQKQLDSLIVTSPMDGRIQTWDVARLLQSRPVVRGQVLMTVADVDGDWEVELDVPDHQISHVYRAMGELKPDLDVRYILKTDPDISYDGRLAEVGTTSLPQEQDESCVRAVVAIDRATVSDLRTGAEVVAHIHCGRAPIGYVWLHDLIDAVKTWVLF